MSKRVLISGGGIAGLGLGFWLDRLGIETVVVDRVPRFEALGHYIVLKGNGVEVIRQMGLESGCRAREIRFERALMLTSAGTLLRTGRRDEFDHNLGGYILCLRADLQAVLFEAVRDKVEIRCGTEIVRVDDTGERVAVELSTGQTESFDAVFGADGIHSRTRRLVFGDGHLHGMGGHYIGLTVDYAHGLPPNHVRSYWGRGQSVHLFLTSPQRVSAVVYHGDGGAAFPARDTASVKAFLLDAYHAFSPEVRAVFAALNEHAFVFADAIAQVRMPVIVKGRVALVGDAAHCPTFMSGMGSSLALQGARALAAQIEQRPGKLAQALLFYQAAIAPVAERYQASARRMRPILLDRRPWVSYGRDLALRLTPEWLMARQTRRFYHAENLARA